MKARIPSKDRLTNKEKQVCFEYLALVQKENVRKFMKLSCFVLNRQFKFGPKRIKRFLDALIGLSKVQENDEVFWDHLDKVVIDELGISFDREEDSDILLK